MQFIQPFFIFLLTYYLILEISKWFKVSHLDASKIFLFRSIICFAYIPIAMNFDSDAYGYYRIGEMGYLGKYLSSHLIHNITYFLRTNFYLNLNFCPKSKISRFFDFLKFLGMA